MKTLVLILALFPILAFADLSECPTYTPPASTPLPTEYTSNSCNGAWSNNTTDACKVTIPCIPSMYGTNIQFLSFTWNSCSFKSSTLQSFTYGGVKTRTGSTCPEGYTNINGSCSLTDPSQLNCPPCHPGMDAGTGDSAETLVCVNDCAVKPRGMTASEIDASGNQIGIKLSYWETTGEKCSAMPTPPPANSTINKANTNCIKNGERELCFVKAKPGCGLVNGVEWCPDKVGCGTVNGKRVCVPDDGGCTPVGGLDFACTKNASPPPAPANEPPPVVDFKGTVPVQDAPAPTGGTPTTGAMPNTSGSDAGTSTPVVIGHYPGNSGNGTIQNPITQGNGGSNGTGGTGGSGSGNIDTSGLAQESSLQSLGGLVTQIRDAIAGTVTGSGFTATTPGPHDNINISPDIQAKQTELSTKLAQVKSEFSTLINFGSASTASALQCPTNSGFQFNGSTISLCTQSVLNATATIGNVLIFLAFVVSLYILLS